MPCKHITECFKKSTTASSMFLTDVWHYNVLTDLHFINDFVELKSHNTSNLTGFEVRRIDRRNLKWSLRHSTDKAELELDTDLWNNIMHSNNIPPTWTEEPLITDKLLDSFNIPHGKKKRRTRRFSELSKLFYKYLCCHIGSDEIVKLRRVFIQLVLTPMMITSSGTGTFIGSKAEGLDMKGSDTDIILPIGFAYENIKPTTCGFKCFKYDSLSSSPGYVFLQDSIADRYLSIFTFQPSMDHTLYRIYRHGPASATEWCKENIDLVLGLKSEHWPAAAKEWKIRQRKFGWPLQELVSQIVNEGCYIVPVSSTEQNVYEWRLSFSIAEMKIVHSFNHTQILVYGLLKLIVKEVISQHYELSELLCSYFLKTVLFWVIEETHASVWTPKYIILCFQLCVERLIQFIRHTNCPNYFIPSNNMFRGRFSMFERDKILKILYNISKHGLAWVWRSETMVKLSFLCNDPFKFRTLTQLQRKNDLIAIYRCVLDLDRQCRNALKLSLKSPERKSWIKFLLKKPILRKNIRKHVFNFLDSNSNQSENKVAYNLNKLHIVLLCHGCRSDLVAGKLKLASYLYNHGRYNDSLQVISIASECFEFRVFHEGFHKTTELPNKLSWIIKGLTRSEIIQNFYRFSTVDVIFLDNGLIIPKELYRIYFVLYYPQAQWANSFNNPFTFFPDTLCHFLRFLCLFKLGDKQKSYQELIKINHVQFIGSAYEKKVYMGIAENLRLYGNMIINRTENEWLKDTENLTNFNSSISTSDMTGVNTDALHDTVEQIEERGFNVTSDLTQLLSGYSFL